MHQGARGGNCSAAASQVFLGLPMPRFSLVHRRLWRQGHPQSPDLARARGGSCLRGCAPRKSARRAITASE
eukprot:1341799-Alexandrium_andersonii.AAC.1